ncbi:heterokaryon incompatibility protein-domain-containing protein [Xylaria palmicola]|nr:heterokaryon incompatibility protein-domain-containing protein [Xylaria palmicola]
MGQSLAKTESRSHSQQPLLPTRVLDVSGNGLRLYVSKAGERSRYATLSYRWGESDLFQTTRDNLDDHCKGIDCERLPNTFKDAIQVAKALQIQYLWIDALCIIQMEDDEGDWKIEAPRMGDIYHNSVFTIAAHCAKDHNEGFLGQGLSSPKLRRVRVPIDLSATSGTQILKSSVRIPGNFQRLVDDGPLSKRGWIFQERFLSRRLLHFGDCEIFWEDSLGIRGEYGSLYNDSTELSNPPEAFYSPRSNMSSFTVKDWCRMVESYTLCSLTRETDRLPAISGVASHLAQSILAAYHFGLWGRHLAYQLLWRPYENSKYRSLKDTPSWSWASYGGAVEYHYIAFDEFQPATSYLGTKVQDIGDNSPSGTVFNGLRTLQLQTTVINIPSSVWETECIRCKGFGVNHYCIITLAASDNTGIKAVITLDYSEDKSGDAWPNNLVAALVGHSRSVEDRSFFLILAPTDRSKSEYRRVGVADVMKKDWIEGGVTAKIDLV